MKFKDTVAADIDNVFLNVDEFAEDVNIDGNSVKIVMDSDLLKELKLSNNGEGLASSELLFHVKKDNLGFVPFVGQDITFNGKLYYIKSIPADDEGLYTITIGVARS